MIWSEYNWLINQNHFKLFTLLKSRTSTNMSFDEYISIYFLQGWLIQLPFLLLHSVILNQPLYVLNKADALSKWLAFPAPLYLVSQQIKGTVFWLANSICAFLCHTAFNSASTLVLLCFLWKLIYYLACLSDNQVIKQYLVQSLWWDKNTLLLVESCIID